MWDLFNYEVCVVMNNCLNFWNSCLYNVMNVWKKFNFIQDLNCCCIGFKEFAFFLYREYWYLLILTIGISFMLWCLCVFFLSFSFEEKKFKFVHKVFRPNLCILFRPLMLLTLLMLGPLTLPHFFFILISTKTSEWSYRRF